MNGSYVSIMKMRICLSDAALLNFSLRKDESEALAFRFISVDESAICLQG